MSFHSAPISRRNVVRGFAAVAASAVVAACGNNAPTATAPSAATATVGANSVTSAPATTTTVTVLVAASPAAVVTRTARSVAIEYWDTSPNGAPADGIRDLVKRFNDMNTGITVTEKAFPDYVTLIQGLQAALAAKTPPAVVQIGYGNLRYVVASLPHQTIDDAVKHDPAGRDFLTKNYTPAVLELGKVDGTLHGLPYSSSVPVLFYNADLFMQAGISQPPQTWTDVRTTAQTLKTRTGKYGFVMDEATTNFWVYQAFIEGNGAKLLVGTGNDVRCGVDSPEAIEAMQLISDMVLKDQSAAHLSQLQGQASFKSGEIAMIATSSAQTGDFQKSAAFHLASSPFPTFDMKPRKMPVGGNDLFIFATDPDKQTAAWEFIKHLESPESLTTWVKATGYVSPRLGVADNPQYLKPYYDGNLFTKPSLDELAEVVPWASWPGQGGLQADSELIDARQRILNGAVVATSLKDAAARVNQLIRM